MEMESEKKSKSFVRYLEGDCSYKMRDEVETLEKMLTASAHNGKQPIDGIKGTFKIFFNFDFDPWNRTHIFVQLFLN